MGIPDLSAIFDVLDPACHGYLTAEHLQQLHQSLHFTAISKQHVEGAISDICGEGSQGKVYKEFFVQVLQEIDRRRSLEEKVRWDFMSLDRNGEHKITIRDSLLLFKVTHANQFSMRTWKKFLASRQVENSDVYFDEIKMFLCALPKGEPASSNEITAEEQRLQTEKQDEEMEEYKRKKKAQEDDSWQAAEAKRREEYHDKTKRMARRKQNRWESEGLEGLLYDDGIDRGEDLPTKKAATTVNVNDLLDALNYKYETLRRKLLGTMLKQQMGELLWSATSDGEQVEQFQQLQLRERQMRQDGSLSKDAKGLYGASVSHGATLLGLMGELEEAFTRMRNSLHDKRLQLRADGKSEEEIDRMLRMEYEAVAKAKCTSDRMLIDLDQRHQSERESLLAKVRENQSSVLLHFCHLKRQHVLVDEEDAYTTSAVAVGLAERPQELERDRYNPDRDRQEGLAADRLASRKGRHPKLNIDGKDARSKVVGRMDLQLDTVRVVALKHTQEREMLVQMLQGKDSNGAKALARQLKPAQRDSKLTLLRNQRNGWRDSGSDFMISQKSSHRRMLQEGVGLYHENRRLELNVKLTQPSDDIINASVLADLQQKQDQEFHAVLQSFQSKTEKELGNTHQQHWCATQEEHLDNVGAVILGSFEVTAKEKLYITALEEKYDMLRHVLFLHVLKDEHGQAWNRFSEEDRQRMIAKKKTEERKMRSDGKLEEMATLLGKVAKSVGTLRELLGEDLAEYKKRMAVIYERQEQAALQGHDFSNVDTDEVHASHIASTNLLADMVSRFYVEQDTLIGHLRSHDMQSQSEQARQLPLVQLKTETHRAENEEWFDIAALMVGLTERIQSAAEIRHDADRKRQARLALQRTRARNVRLELGHIYQKQLDEHARPAKGDTIGWMESYLKEMDKKQIDEREVLLSVLQDPSFQDLSETAATMPTQEQHKRLGELRTKRRALNFDYEADREEHISILEEAAAIHFVIKKRLLEGTAGSTPGADDVIGSLLADVQDEEDREMAEAMQRLAVLEETELKSRREDQIESRKHETLDSAMAVLTRYEGVGEDEEILKALDDKYDALRDKLLLDALRRQLGEAEWKLLSEEERQKRLMQLKLQERKLRREGRQDELAKLLGENTENEEALRKLMGDNRAEYERKLRERLARRKKRMEEGLDPEDEEDSGIEEEEEEGKSALEDLQSRYEQEKQALLARLRGIDEDFISERERQAELVRLRREKRQAENEDKFENAALIIGLAERQQAAANEKLKNDRLRQEQLAKERLEAMKRKRGQKQDQEVPVTVITEGGRGELQDAVMRQLDARHAEERQMLADILEGTRQVKQEDRLAAQASSEQERAEKLEELEARIGQLQPDDFKGKQELLIQACCIKMEGRREKLTAEREAGAAEVLDDDVSVSLMADLQDRQDKETVSCINSMTDQSDGDLIELQKKVIAERQGQQVPNVVKVLTQEEESDRVGEKELIAALDRKYDALRDKLLAEALIKECGEADWRRMSEKEKQQRLTELKLKEKQLRREGRLDEAAALLGGALKDQEALEKLMGDTRAEQERKLKERLERRKKRIAEGMSEEEAEQLEKEEVEKEEEEEKKKRKNVLLDLQHHYDKEKEELLRSMHEGDRRLASERERQLELVRLKREQRYAHREDNFRAAALMIGIAQEHDRVRQKRLPYTPHCREADRERQERLAKERLAARRAAREKGQIQPSTENEVVATPESESDVVALQEAILKEIDLKHTQEREILIQLLQTEGTETARQKVREMSSEERAMKLEELKELRQYWRQGGANDPQEQLDLFKEAIPVKAEVYLEQFKSGASEEDLQVALLADLQQEQDQELHMLQMDLTEKPGAVLKQLKTVLALARTQQWYDNIATVLLQGEQDTSTDGLTIEEAELVKALDKKYDAARDKLLMEALIKEMGEADWKRLSEKERQERLVQLKLQERKLRQEGRYEEAAALLGRLVEDQEAFQKKLGDSLSEQQRKLQERLKRRKELLAEREAKGLSTDEAVVEAVLDQEEEQQEEENRKRRNILQDLQHHYDDEKEALLAQLRSSDEKLHAERQRQLNLARLRQEQRRLEREEKFDGAALLIASAIKRDETIEANMVKERERQQALARERLEARRRLRQKSREQDVNQLAEQLKLEQQEAEMKEALEEAQLQQEGGVAVQEAILTAMEQKHLHEREVFMELMQAAQQDGNKQQEADNMDSEDLKLQLEKLRQERTKWRRTSRQQALRMSEMEVSADEKSQHLQEVAEGRVEQFKLLTQAVVYRAAAERRWIQERDPDLAGDKLVEEVSVCLLADLQDKQGAEGGALQAAMLEKDDKVLMNLKRDQHTSMQEGWLDNLANTIFSISHEGALEPIDEAVSAKLQEDLNKEFEQEKEELLEKLQRQGKEGEAVDVEGELARLEAQQAARRQAMNEAMTRQHRLAMEKLEARKQARANKEYEADASVEMIKMAERQHSFVLEKKKEDQGRQNDMMQQKLAERREARRQAAEEERQKKEEEQRKQREAQLPPGMGLKREKTALDIEVSEDQKQELMQQLVQEQSNMHKRISEEQSRQEELIRRKLQERKERNRTDAQALLSLGERQKTVLERSKKDEHDRQITMIKDRIARVKYERTMTMKEKGDHTAKQFDEFVGGDVKGLSEDEKMQLAARKMEEKFKKEEKDAKQGKRKVVTEETQAEEAPPVSDTQKSRVLGQKEKMDLLKQRRLEKKRQREQEREKDRDDQIPDISEV